MKDSLAESAQIFARAGADLFDGFLADTASRLGKQQEEWEERFRAALEARGDSPEHIEAHVSNMHLALTAAVVKAAFVSLYPSETGSYQEFLAKVVLAAVVEKGRMTGKDPMAATGPLLGGELGI